MIHYIYIYIHTYTYTYTYIYILFDISMYMYIYIYISVYFGCISFIKYLSLISRLQVCGRGILSPPAAGLARDYPPARVFSQGTQRNSKTHNTIPPLKGKGIKSPEFPLE